jgi:hypothetical protein
MIYNCNQCEHNQEIINKFLIEIKSLRNRIAIIKVNLNNLEIIVNS